MITQLYGDRMMIANATGCSSIYGASAPATPYTKNEDGKGPAWANSLFEDNAEFGYGFVIAHASMRNHLQELMKQGLQSDSFRQNSMPCSKYGSITAKMPTSRNVFLQKLWIPKRFRQQDCS